MAIVTTTFNLANANMEMQRIPYSGIGAMDAVNTPIPRAELNYLISAGDIAVATGGDSQKITIVCDLPLSFAYVVQEISILSLEGVDGDEWENFGVCRLRTTSPSGTWSHSLDLSSRGAYSRLITATPGWGKSYHLTAPGELNRLIIPGTSANLLISLRNPTVDGSAMVIAGFMARFIQFDVNQAYFYGANTPVPVR